jgi:hypothetical protein
MSSPSYASQTRLCRGCGKDWYSAVFLSRAAVNCPECGLSLSGSLASTSELIVSQLIRAASERPDLMDRAPFN